MEEESVMLVWNLLYPTVNIVIRHTAKTVRPSNELFVSGQLKVTLDVGMQSCYYHYFENHVCRKYLPICTFHFSSEANIGTHLKVVSMSTCAAAKFQVQNIVLLCMCKGSNNFLSGE